MPQSLPANQTGVEPELATERRGAVVTGIKLPETPAYLASCESHVASVSESMQMVGADTQAKERGIRQWVTGNFEEDSAPVKPASAKSSATIIQNGPGQGPVSKMYSYATVEKKPINIYRISRQSRGLRVACRRPTPSHLQVKYHRLQHHRHKTQKPTRSSSLNRCQCLLK